MAMVLEQQREQAQVEDGDRYEIVFGQRKEKPIMGMLQGWVASTLLVYLGDFVRERRLGKVIAETLFVLDQSADLKRRPDLAFVSRTRWSRGPEMTNAWNVVPDLAVEVISPTNTADDLVDKIEEYFVAGVRLVWVVYCAQQKIYVYASPKQIAVLGVEDELDGGDVIAEFRLPVAKLFEDLNPSEDGDRR